MAPPHDTALRRPGSRAGPPQTGSIARLHQNLRSGHERANGVRDRLCYGPNAARRWWSQSCEWSASPSRATTSKCVEPAQPEPAERAEPEPAQRAALEPYPVATDGAPRNASTS